MDSEYRWMDTAVVLLDNTIFLDPVLRSGKKITKLLDHEFIGSPTCRRMEVFKTGRTNGATNGVVVGRRYVMMPRSETKTTGEWCVQN